MITRGILPFNKNQAMVCGLDVGINGLFGTGIGATSFEQGLGGLANSQTPPMFGQGIFAPNGLPGPAISGLTGAAPSGAFNIFLDMDFEIQQCERNS
jgi:hypothetical protein